MGDSVGRWEGDTLVVDTTNFNDGGGFYGDAGGNFGWDRNLHLVERFSLLDADTLLYQFEIDNPTAFTQPWKGELTMARSTGPIYEFACHEGNYALPNMLSGFPRQRTARRRPYSTLTTASPESLGLAFPDSCYSQHVFHHGGCVCASWYSVRSPSPSF